MYRTHKLMARLVDQNDMYSRTGPSEQLVACPGGDLQRSGLVTQQQRMSGDAYGKLVVACLELTASNAPALFERSAPELARAVHLLRRLADLLALHHRIQRQPRGPKLDALVKRMR
jgi:hypothetical protein